MTTSSPLNLGSCKNAPGGGDVYCQRKVVNSFCATQKDECFCLPGHVSIREEDNRVACKTQHAELREGISLCQKCLSSQGVCYIEDTVYRYHEVLGSNSQQFINRMRLNHGCACPGNTAMPNLIDSQFNNICKASLKNLDEPCGKEGEQCRAFGARCTSDFTSAPAICRCPFSTIPLYQRNLGYYECLPLLSEVSMAEETLEMCEKCREAEGKCYSFDRSKTKRDDFECACPSFLETVEKKGGQSTQFCKRQLVTVGWDRIREQIRVCYKPHSQVPFSRIAQDLKTKNARLRIQATDSYHVSVPSDTSCDLTKDKPDSDGSIKYCISLPVGTSQFRSRLPCGLTEIPYRNGLAFDAKLIYQLNNYGNSEFSRFGDFSVKFQVLIETSGSSSSIVSLQDDTWNYAQSGASHAWGPQETELSLDLLGPMDQLSWKIMSILDGNKFDSCQFLPASEVFTRLEMCELSTAEKVLKNSRDVLKLDFRVLCKDGPVSRELNLTSSGINKLALWSSKLDGDESRKVQISQPFRSDFLADYANSRQILLKCQARICSQHYFCHLPEDEVCEMPRKLPLFAQYPSSTGYLFRHPIQRVVVHKVVAVSRFPPLDDSTLLANNRERRSFKQQEDNHNSLWMPILRESYESELQGFRFADNQGLGTYETIQTRDIVLLPTVSSMRRNDYSTTPKLIMGTLTKKGSQLALEVEKEDTMFCDESPQNSPQSTNYFIVTITFRGKRKINFILQRVQYGPDTETEFVGSVMVTEKGKTRK
ncbi:hypothetical protein Ciccas_003797 [Cichlidogyrus casuarinus]|uniref:Uncharacterized protein n=1 Tax=Cichlidogyrus casuarinus TaxID=1844966 RepID=A0ABD2QDS7_9PLAT